MSIIKHVTLQKIVAHDFWYDPCIWEVQLLADKLVASQEGCWSLQLVGHLVGWLVHLLVLWLDGWTDTHTNRQDDI